MNRFSLFVILWSCVLHTSRRTLRNIPLIVIKTYIYKTHSNLLDVNKSLTKHSSRTSILCIFTSHVSAYHYSLIHPSCRNLHLFCSKSLVWSCCVPIFSYGHLDVGFQTSGLHDKPKAYQPQPFISTHSFVCMLICCNWVVCKTWPK